MKNLFGTVEGIRHESGMLGYFDLLKQLPQNFFDNGGKNYLFMEYLYSLSVKG